MRQMIAGAVALVATMAAGAVPASACGGVFTSPCAPCQSYASPCGGGYYGYTGYQRLPDPVYQYYWVNQGPSYTGPGRLAPYPYYRESALPRYGYYGYTGGYYSGGPYANPVNHGYVSAPSWGPVVYTYRPNHYRPGIYRRAWHHHGHYGYRPHRYGWGGHHHGYGYRHGYRAGYRYGMPMHHMRPMAGR